MDSKLWKEIISKPPFKNPLPSIPKLPGKTDPHLHPAHAFHYPPVPAFHYLPVPLHLSKNPTPTATPSLTPMTPPTGILLSTLTEPNSNPLNPSKLPNLPVPANKHPLPWTLLLSPTALDVRVLTPLSTPLTNPMGVNKLTPT